MATTTSEPNRPLGRLGHLMVAIAEPHRDAVAEYDRWFEAEHMYDAVLVGPGAYAANRYIATRELKALRQPLDGGVFDDATKGSSLALYYLAPGTAEEHFAWSFPQNAWLGETGGNNADRTIVLTWLCDAAGVLVRPGHRVAPGRRVSPISGPSPGCSHGLRPDTISRVGMERVVRCRLSRTPSGSCFRNNCRRCPSSDTW